MNRAAVIPAVTFVAGVLGGYLVAVLLWVELTANNIEFDPLNAFVTILVALWLSVVFQRQFSEARGEKDLLLAQTREVGTALRECRNVFLSAYGQTVTQEVDTKILSEVRLASIHMSALELAAVGCSIDYRAHHLTNLRWHFRKFRTALTERARSDRPYDEKEYASAENEYGSMTSALLMYQIHLNKR